MRRVLLVVIVLCMLLASLSAVSAQTAHYACLRVFSTDSQQRSITHLIHAHSGNLLLERRTHVRPYTWHGFSLPELTVYAPDVQKTLYTRASGTHPTQLDLWLSTDIHSPSRLLLTFTPTISYGIGAFSPDSSRFAWIYNKRTAQGVENYLLLGDADGQNIQHILVEGAEGDTRFSEYSLIGARWSSDGQYIELTLGQSVTFEIYLWDVRHNQLLPKPVYVFIGDNSWMRRSPTGQHFAGWESEAVYGTDQVVIKTLTGQRLAAYPLPEARFWKSW